MSADHPENAVVGAVPRDGPPVQWTGTAHLVKGCHGCDKAYRSQQKPLRRCARCNKALYCSRECQIDHWPEHKTKCKLNAKMNEEANNSPDGGRAWNEFDEWVSCHNRVFALVFQHALKLDTDPDAYKSKALAVKLEPKADSASYPLRERYNVASAEVADLHELREAVVAVLGDGLETLDQPMANGERFGVIVISSRYDHFHFQHAYLSPPEEIKAALREAALPEDWVSWLDRAVNENFEARLKGPKLGKVRRRQRRRQR